MQAKLEQFTCRVLHEFFMEQFAPRLGNGEVCKQARDYVLANRDYLGSLRATASLLREIIENGPDL
jgi:hypothetical protein